jgi:CRP-like cAMP-binding protein
MIHDLLPKLKEVPGFKNVPDAQLQWLASKGTLQRFEDGERVFARGDAIGGFQIILTGEVSLHMTQAGSRRELGIFETGDILGRLPYSRMRHSSVDGLAVGKLVLFQLSHEFFPELITTCHEITEVLVHHMTDRVRDYTRFQQQNDKMMALGKLSAGLAHELNNPSAAVVRSAQELKKHLKHVPEKFKEVMEIRSDDATIQLVNSLVFEKMGNLATSSLSLMEKSAVEEELCDWLDQNEVKDGYQMTEVFG